MPHTARRRSSSGCYHVVPKGIAGQLIFESDADRQYYVRLLEKAKRETGIRLQGFIHFSQAKNGTFLPFPGSKLRNHNSDDEAVIIAKAILGFEPHNIVGMNSATRDSCIQLLGERGFGRNLIMRMTGVGRRVVERCLA